MCILEARQAAGVDKDDGSIRNARSTLAIIQNIALAKGVPLDAPSFLREPALKEVVQFYTADITEPTELPPDYYDIAFCDYVLNHIWLDKGEAATQGAIEEMARVVRPGGLVAAHEPTQRTSDPFIFKVTPCGV